ncbi:MAG: hypothetical protein Q7T04_04720 [Dehalococcoidia bacterium]|nr:hypothetical protein [Dehalococcoidia bacterium]
MFYEVLPDPIPSETVSAMVALTPSESKRLLAKAVAILPEVKRALQIGTVVIAKGTTNAFVVEELLGIKIDKAEYSAGVIAQGSPRVNPATLPRPYVLRKGQLVDVSLSEAVKDFGPEDVFIKGANAVDMEGNVGILVTSNVAGTIGAALPIVTPRGSHLIMPVGLEKLVPSVLEAARKCGIFRFKYAIGSSPGMVPVVTGKVVTEVQALAVLGGVRATHVASGGVGGSEGSVVLAVEGTEANVKRAFDLVASLKGEPPVGSPAQTRL